MLFGHLTEIVGLVFIGLLVFGPKKMIDMASALGRAVREFRAATKDLSWQELTGMGSATETPRQTAMSKLSQFSQALGVAATQPTSSTTTATASADVVDAAVDPVPTAAEATAQPADEVSPVPTEQEPAATTPGADAAPSA
jgi:TatA/E family protein of Tat protein translocase